MAKVCLRKAQLLGRLTHPTPHGRITRQRRALDAGAVERALQSADDQCADIGSIAEADFGFGRVDVYVDLPRRNVDEQCDDSMAIAREAVRISAADCPRERAILHRPAVHKKILMVGNARDCRSGGQLPPQAHAAAFMVEGNAGFDQLGVDQRRDARRACLRLHR